MKKQIEWLVDRSIQDETGDTTRLDIKRDGLELQMERLSYGRSAVVFSKSSTDSPFTATLTDSAETDTGQSLTFSVAISGYMTGNLLNKSSFVIYKNCGILADFSAGSADFILHSGQPVRSFAGEFDVDTLSDLLGGASNSQWTEVFEEMTTKPGSLLRSFRVTPQIRQLASNALNNTQLVGPLRRLYMEGVSLQILALILDQRETSPLLGPPEEIKSVARKSAIKEVAGLLGKDLQNPPTMAQLSKDFGLSARQLNAGFKKYYDCSVFDYLCEKRLTAAKELLLEQPDFPLKILAHKMGYTHTNNFIAAFKRKFGMPPKQYAKLHRH